MPFLLILLIILIVAYLVFIPILIIIGHIKTKNSPQLTVSAKVVDKRAETSHRGIIPITLGYYITFEIDNCEKMEFYVPKEDYILIIKGDMGNLTYQNRTFLKFERNM